ncbi:MAG: hypothetical protein ATN31_00490 [Candidatus Epulonipiscioides saccharophilum]|nr:MAG: hypothetical protein ATN31_00490 [Epulopiscium sp. AS2M-Bin001]
MKVSEEYKSGLQCNDDETIAEKIAKNSFKPIMFENLKKENIKLSATKLMDYSIEPSCDSNTKKVLKTRFIDSGNASITVEPLDGQPWDLSDNRIVLAFDVTNPNNVTHRLITCIHDKLGMRGYVNPIPAQSKKTMYCVIDESLREKGTDFLPSPIGFESLILGEGWGEVNKPSEILSIDLQAGMNGPVGYFIFENFRLVENPIYNIDQVYKGIVDKYGQYSAREWPGKIHTDEELKSAQLAEERLVVKWKEEQAKRDDRTIYGGYKEESLKQAATGRFYTKKIDNKWNLIDPEGYPYFAIGFDIVRKSGMDTWIDGRRYMFEELPDKNGEFKEHYATVSGVQPPYGETVGETFSFYSMNLQKKYGKDWLDKWAKMSIDRFKAWGINSLGAWAEPELFFGKGLEHNTPYTAFIWTTGGDGKHEKLHDTVPDAFDPEFINSVEKAVKEQAVKFRIDEDPYCFGVYIDNEYIWGRTLFDNPLVKSVFKYDTANEKAYAKRRVMDILKEKYQTIEHLNKSWHTNFAFFKELSEPYIGFIPEDVASLVISTLADKYYEIVEKTVRQYLPGVMYLGSRNTEWGTPREVIQAAIKYVDILSFNNYNFDVQRENFKYEEYDLPMIIGEFSFSADDCGPFSYTSMSVATQQDRARAYVNYVESALKSGKFVGVNWFQYYDEPVLGRSWDGENFGWGFVDVTDQYYPELIEASRELYNTMYATKFNQQSMFNVRNVQQQIFLNVGETAKIESVTHPLNLNQQLSYYSTNKYVATIDQFGTVTALKDGVATIITKNINDLFVLTTTNISVGKAPCLPNVCFIYPQINVQVGAKINLIQNLVPDSVLPQNLVWKSSQKTIATVADGVVIAHSPGRVNIVVSEKNGFATDSLNLVIE